MFQDRGHLQGNFPETCTAECKTIFEPFYVRKCLFELLHCSRTQRVRVPQSQAECEDRIGGENSYQASSDDARSYANCKTQSNPAWLVPTSKEDLRKTVLAKCQGAPGGGH